MSLHKSLAVKSTLSRSRNVFSRAERIEKLLTEGRWKEGESLFGLPKVKTRLKTRKVKKEKKPAEGAAVEGAAPAEGVAAAAPAAGAAKPEGKAAAKKAAKPAKK